MRRTAALIVAVSTLLSTLGVAVDVATAPPAAASVEEPWLDNPACDPVWCRYRHIGLGAYARGDYLTAVWAAFIAYGVPQWANWAWITIGCESGGNPNAYSGYYIGFAQHDPYLFAARAIAAGLPGVSPWNGFENVSVMAWMISAGYGPEHWPVCGRNGWRP